MTDTQQQPGLVIELEAEFAATPEQVFARWTDAAALARWFAPPGPLFPDGTVRELWSRGTRVLQRRDGRWQLTHQHVSFPVDAAGQASSQR